MITPEDIRLALTPLVYDIKAPGMSAEWTRAALDRAVQRIGDLIADAQASEAELAREGEQRAQRARAARVTAFERGSVWD